jgi:hypothetical protein
VCVNAPGGFGVITQGGVKLKKFYLLIILMSAAAMAAPVHAATTYGSGVTLDQVTPVSTIFEKPGAYVGKTMAVEGLIVDVCGKRGCWMELASDKPFEKIRIKVTDGEIVFPLTARGLNARVQGKLQEIKMSKEQAMAYEQHKAEESGKKFDPASVTGPRTLYQIRATGAVIGD